MLEKIIAFIFWLIDIFTTSRDPFLEEYRKYWRRMVMFSMAALLGFVCTILISPTEVSVTGLKLVVNNFTALLYLGFSVVTLSAAIGFLWTAYRYWIFVDKNE